MTNGAYVAPFCFFRSVTRLIEEEEVLQSRPDCKSENEEDLEDKRD